MAVDAKSRITVVILSVLLVSWGGLANFNFASAAAPTCNGHPATIIGTSGPDVINGTSGDDVILGLAGNDIINGNGGDDIVCSGPDDDVVITGSGNDEIHGDGGSDTFDAGDGNNLIDADFGNDGDIIKTGSGDDYILLGDGDDTIDSGSGNNEIISGGGNDTITAGNGDDTIYGGNGVDVIDAGDGNNYIEGNNGNDIITAGSDDDTIYGGNGVDVIDAGDGNNYIEGNSGNDTITAGSGDDTILGGLGDDCINSRGGSDSIDGGAGTNFINSPCTVSDSDGDEIVKRLTAEKRQKDAEKKIVQNELKKKHKDLKNEIKTLKNSITQFKSDLQVKETKELKNEIKELIKELREEYDNYDADHNEELKQQLDRTKYKEIRDLVRSEKYAKQKVDSKLTSLSKSSDPASHAKKLGLDFKNGKTKIVIQVSELTPKVLETIQSLGKIDTQNGNTIQVTVDVNAVSKLHTIYGVEKIRPTFSAVQFDEPFLSEGTYFINADLVQYAGITGKGVKVAVLDLAFDVDNPKIADNVVDVKSFRQGFKYPVAVEGVWHEDKHGTAVAEIISDVAPDAELFLYTMRTDIEFGAAVDEAISSEVDVIVMSAGWPNFPTDGSSHITKKVEEAIANDIVFVIPSGNFANKHWQGEYTDSNANGWHEFESVDEGLTMVVTEEQIAEQEPIIAYLGWDVGLGDVRDFDFVLVDPLGQIVDYSANEQITKSDTPFEYIHHVPETEGTYALGVVFSTDSYAPVDTLDATLEIFTVNHEIDHSVAASSVSVPADAEGVIVVGAVNHMDGELESFSSQGPTNNGKLAPHVVGPDRVTTVALDGEPFYGTSATAPYIAGIAALLLETNSEISPQQILNSIEQNTASTLYSSVETQYDNAMGYGTANALFLTEQKEALI